MFSNFEHGFQRNFGNGTYMYSKGGSVKYLYKQYVYDVQYACDYRVRVTSEERTPVDADSPSGRRSRNRFRTKMTVWIRIVYETYQDLAYENNANPAACALFSRLNV